MSATRPRERSLTFPAPWTSSETGQGAATATLRGAASSSSSWHSDSKSDASSSRARPDSCLDAHTSCATAPEAAVSSSPPPWSPPPVLLHAAGRRARAGSSAPSVKVAPARRRKQVTWAEEPLGAATEAGTSLTSNQQPSTPSVKAPNKNPLHILTNTLWTHSGSRVSGVSLGALHRPGNHDGLHCERLFDALELAIVVDGHGSVACAAFVKERLGAEIRKRFARVLPVDGEASGDASALFAHAPRVLKKSIASIEAAWWHHVMKHDTSPGARGALEPTTGGCSVTALVVDTARGQVVVSSLGNVAVVMGTGKHHAWSLTRDPEPGDSPASAMRFGATDNYHAVISVGAYQVDPSGRLRTCVEPSTSSIKPCAPQHVVPALRPHRHYWPIHIHRHHRHPLSSWFAVIASDGLWDCVSGAQAAHEVARVLQRGESVNAAVMGLLRLAALERKGADDITLAVVRFGY